MGVGSWWVYDRASALDRQCRFSSKALLLLPLAADGLVLALGAVQLVVALAAVEDVLTLAPVELVLWTAPEGAATVRALSRVRCPSPAPIPTAWTTTATESAA